ncbi:hypothetical protein ANTQUA_LOCUS10663 [Anthophora quadrimaculata]
MGRFIVNELAPVCARCPEWILGGSLGGHTTYGSNVSGIQRTRWDPKDGELCLVRTKSGETLMEVRSDSDVQIDRRNWV